MQDQATTAMIRAAADDDAAAIAAIYNHYVLHTIVTFEEEAVPAEEMRDRVRETQAAGLPFLVAAPGGDVQAFAYASAWKGRCAYRFSREVTVYVRHGEAGRGLGSALYASMIPQLQQLGLHALLGGIALPNEASVALHEKFGFTKTAHLREVGWKFNRWIDVGYWQRLL
jgi:phosphinothricin acetyltransferase